MQRLSTTCLSLSLTVMVTAISLALLAAAWALASHLLNGPSFGSYPLLD